MYMVDRQMTGWMNIQIDTEALKIEFPYVNVVCTTFTYGNSILRASVLPSVFLISSYGAPLAQRASTLAQHSSLLGADGVINNDYIVTNSINSLLIGCIPNGAHTNHC